MCCQLFASFGSRIRPDPSCTFPRSRPACTKWPLPYLHNTPASCCWFGCVANPCLLGIRQRLYQSLHLLTPLIEPLARTQCGPAHTRVFRRRACPTPEQRMAHTVTKARIPKVLLKTGSS